MTIRRGVLVGALLLVALSGGGAAVVLRYASRAPLRVTPTDIDVFRAVLRSQVS